MAWNLRVLPLFKTRMMPELMPLFSRFSFQRERGSSSHIYYIFTLTSTGGVRAAFFFVLLFRQTAFASAGSQRGFCFLHEAGGPFSSPSQRHLFLGFSTRPAWLFTTASEQTSSSSFSERSRACSLDNRYDMTNLVARKRRDFFGVYMGRSLGLGLLGVDRHPLLGFW